MKDLRGTAICFPQRDPGRMQRFARLPRRERHGQAVRDDPLGCPCQPTARARRGNVEQSDSCSRSDGFEHHRHAVARDPNRIAALVLPIDPSRRRRPVRHEGNAFPGQDLQGTTRALRRAARIRDSKGSLRGGGEDRSDLGKQRRLIPTAMARWTADQDQTPDPARRISRGDRSGQCAHGRQYMRGRLHSVMARRDTKIEPRRRQPRTHQDYQPATIRASRGKTRQLRSTTSDQNQVRVRQRIQMCVTQAHHNRYDARRLKRRNRVVLYRTQLRKSVDQCGHLSFMPGFSVGKEPDDQTIVSHSACSLRRP